MENQRKPLPIIMGINISIIILVTLYNSESPERIFFGGIMALGLVALNFLGMIVCAGIKQRDVEKAFLLSAGLCLLISGGLCAYS